MIKSYPFISSKVVYIGDIPLGGQNPIRVQSMTNTNTLDSQATIDQSKKIIEAGADYIRITTPKVKDAENLVEIKKQLKKSGFNTPIIADIHYSSRVALIAAGSVEKIRINPGNFAFSNTKKKANTNELEIIHENIAPLLHVCKQNGTAIRIGVNHGSLSPRILEKYGNTPVGIVKSAIEYIKIFEDHGFQNLVISLKSSNPKVMVYANRLLVKYMMDNGNIYPLHLGVTEAGEGEDGRIKSAVGIGTLLQEGIGDTIRVSLTEPPEKEIPVAKKIAQMFNKRKQKKERALQPAVSIFQFQKRAVKEIQNIGGHNHPVVITKLKNASTPGKLSKLSFKMFNGKWEPANSSPDYLLVDKPEMITAGNNLHYIVESSLIPWKVKNLSYFVPGLKNYLSSQFLRDIMAFVECKSEDVEKIKNYSDELIKDNTLVIVLNADEFGHYAKLRKIFALLQELGLKIPVILKMKAARVSNIYISSLLGGFFIDGLANGILLHGSPPFHKLNSLSFDLLQACGARLSKTEFISCPTCGRTQFDIGAVLQEVKKKTKHLKGLKIAVMGCTVNGPGEMADADYGYVGSGKDKVALYKGKEVIKKNIDQEKALDELVELIKIHGDWIEIKNE